MTQQLPVELQRRHKFTLLLTKDEVDRLTQNSRKTLRSKSSIALEGLIENLDRIESEIINRNHYKSNGSHPADTRSILNE